MWLFLPEELDSGWNSQRAAVMDGLPIAYMWLYRRVDEVKLLWGALEQMKEKRPQVQKTPTRRLPVPNLAPYGLGNDSRAQGRGANKMRRCEIHVTLHATFFYIRHQTGTNHRVSIVYGCTLARDVAYAVDRGCTVFINVA
jgi:hypothetical protein